MSLFDSGIDDLNEFRNNKLIVSALGNNVILSKNEFLKWFTPEKQKTVGETSRKIKEANTSLITSILNTVCRSGIDVVYTKTSLSRVIPKRRADNTIPRTKFDYKTLKIRQNKHFNVDDDKKFDIVVGVEKDVYENSTADFDTKAKGVASFLVTELGECNDRPNTISVNLICSRQYHQLKGSFLMGATLYCVKKSNIYDHEVVLELAGKYNNIGGFFSYTGVGFDRDKDLYGDNCFDAIENLPMSINLRTYTTNDIIGLTSKTQERENIKDETGLYANRSTLTKDAQKQIVKIANYLHELDVDEEPNTRLYRSIVMKSRTKEEKKKRLLMQIQALTPKNTPERVSRKRKLETKSATKTLVKKAKKIFKKELSQPKQQSRSKRYSLRRRQNKTVTKSKATKSTPTKTRGRVPRISY